MANPTTVATAIRIGNPARLVEALAALEQSDGGVRAIPDSGSLAAFSNLFRYKLLLERGGWWVDTDVICLRPFRVRDELVIASEPVKFSISVA